MFQSSTTRLRVWLQRLDDVLDDILGDPPPDAPAAPPLPESPVAHPHRQALRWKRARRGGSVSARPGHCLSPIRAGPWAAGFRDLAGR
jgi:hypothetical protein